MGLLLFYFYRWILWPIATLVLFLLKPLIRGKLQEISGERQKNQWVFLKNPKTSIERPIWIHAASGEIEYARPLIREFKKQFPHIPVVVTYSSPSAKRILQKMSEVDAWGPSPWDSVFSCRKFLARVNPRSVYFSRTDVWPEISYQLRQKKIPTTLFSATFAKNSSRLKGLSKYLTVWTLRQLTNVLVVAEEDQSLLQNCGFPGALVAGDTRYDQVFYRLAHPQKVHEISKPSGFKVLVAGSTWPEDEAVLFSWFVESRKKKSVKLLLAPHEISTERLKKIKDFFKENEIQTQLYTESSPWTADVLIVDQIGVLAELYSWGHAAFVGGSFRRQVHSVMEPLACGIPVCLGPFHLNNREALEFQKIAVPLPAGDHALVRCVRSIQDLEIFWQEAQALKPQDHLALQRIIAAKKGATQQILQSFDISI